MRILDFADGFESSSAPSSVSFPASTVSVTPSGNLSSTTAQAALQELQGDVDTINAKVGAVSGIASLDAGGKIPTSQIPALAIIDVNVVANITARNALTVEEGDVALVTDAGGGVSKTYIYDGSSWIELKTDGSLASHTAATTGVHGVTGNIVGTTDTQTLSNKTLTTPVSDIITFTEQGSTPSAPSSGSLKVYAKTDNKLYYQTPAGVESPVGSGSGSGTVNFVTNPKAETDTSNISVYNDGATSRPVDGTGGVATISIARNTTNALDTTDLLITKPASNVQGQGVAWDVTIPRYMRGKVCQITIYYEVASGTYSGGTSSTDSDLIAYIYSVTDSKLNEPAPMKLDGGVVGTQYTYRGTFQTSTTDASLRLLLHHATTSASAFTMKVTTKVSDQVFGNGAYIGDRTSKTVTGSWTAGATYTCFETKEGDGANYEVFVNVTGTPTATSLTVNLPTGRTIDTSKLPGGASTIQRIGDATMTTGGGATGWEGPVTYASTTSVQVKYVASTGNFGNVTNSAPGAFSSGDVISLKFRVPLVGASTSQTLSSENSGRLVAAQYYGTAGTQTIPNSDGTFATVYKVTTKILDTHGMYDTSTGRYTIAEPGCYNIAASVALDAAGGSNVELDLFVNGVKNRAFAWNANCSVILGSIPNVPLNAGDYIEVRPFQNSGASRTITNNNQFSWFSVHKVSNPAQIATTESTTLSYSKTTTQTFTSGTAATVTGWTLEYDANGIFNPTTGIGRMQTPGKYRFVASMAWNAANSTSSQIYIQKSTDGTTWTTSAQVYRSNTSAFETFAVTKSISFNSSDYFRIQLVHVAGTDRSLNADASECFFCIERVGN